ALGLAAERAEWLRRAAGTTSRFDDVDVAAARAVVEATLSEHDDAWLEPGAVRALLEAYRVPLVPEHVVPGADAAVAAADVLADVGGCVAADARVRIRVSLPSSGPKTW